MAQSALKACEICQRGTGTNYCLECEQFLCNECKILHTRQKVTKKHKFQEDLSEIPEVKSRCKDHDDDFIFLCVQCDALVCKRCISSGNHKGHDMSDIDDVISKLKESITKSAENDDVIQKINKGLKSLETETESVVKKIKEEGSKMKELIDKETEKKIAMLKTKVNTEKQKLERLLTEARELKKKNTNLNEKVLKLQDSRDASLIKQLKDQKKIIDKMSSLTIAQMPIVKYSPKSITTDDVTKLMGTYMIQGLKEGRTETQARPPTRAQEKQQETQHGYLYRCLGCRKEAVHQERPHNQPYLGFDTGRYFFCEKCNTETWWTFVKNV